MTHLSKEGDKKINHQLKDKMVSQLIILKNLKSLKTFEGKVICA